MYKAFAGLSRCALSLKGLFFCCILLGFKNGLIVVPVENTVHSGLIAVV